MADVTITTCCALPTLANCWTSNGVAGGMGVAVGAGGLAVAVGTGFAVGVGVGVGVAAAMSGDGMDAGELATSALAVALAGSALAAPALDGPALALVVVVPGELRAGVDAAPADDE